MSDAVAVLLFMLFMLCCSVRSFSSLLLATHLPRQQFRANSQPAEVGDGTGMLEVLTASFAQERSGTSRAFDSARLVDVYVSGCDHEEEKDEGYLDELQEQDAASAAGLLSFSQWLKSQDRWALFGGESPTSLDLPLKRIRFSSSEKAALGRVFRDVVAAHNDG